MKSYKLYSKIRSNCYSGSVDRDKEREGKVRRKKKKKNKKREAAVSLYIHNLNVACG